MHFKSVAESREPRDSCETDEGARDPLAPTSHVHVTCLFPASHMVEEEQGFWGLAASVQVLALPPQLTCASVSSTLTGKENTTAVGIKSVEGVRGIGAQHIASAQ